MSTNELNVPDHVDGLYGQILDDCLNDSVTEKNHEVQGFPVKELRSKNLEALKKRIQQFKKNEWEIGKGGDIQQAPNGDYIVLLIMYKK